MKEIIKTSLISEKDKQEIHAQVKQEFKLKGTMRVVKGMTLYQFNFDTWNVSEVEIQVNKTLVFQEGKAVEKIERKAIHDGKHGYLWALNMKNAQRKVDKIIDKISNQK